MYIEASPPGQDRDVAIVECARAAMAWYDPRGAGSKKLAVVRRAMARAARAKGGALPARTLSEFLALLNRPVEEWLNASGGPLVEAGAVTELALDTIAETGGADAEAEIVQARVGGTRATFAARDNGDEEYPMFRRFLVEHATATVDEAQAGLLAAGLAPPDLFEEIPPSCKEYIGAKEVFYPCPRCRWPMRSLESVIQCASNVCQSNGARYRKNRGGLSAMGAMDPPIPVPVNERLRLIRAVWRYTLQPGLVELDLGSRLGRIPGVKLLLWPERDRYDLHVQVGERVWMVDVKDWSSAAALADHLRRQITTKGLHIVVPEWRGDQVSLLRQRCHDPKLHFCTDKQFLRIVRAKTIQARGGNEKTR